MKFSVEEQERLTTVDQAQGALADRGWNPHQHLMVDRQHHVTTVDLHVPPTAEQQARATEAGRRAPVENAAFRAELEAEMWRTFHARKKIREAGGDPDAPPP